ncbi:class I SAM-dependent methyltransferase [Rhizobium mongolense]|uniref:SAM-dependent methyltransferase n=1 Tax=Rhizobium mongolense TaxID=57676 RepID=A0A7W6RSZ9_9HYPH|nr:class I SAM-dependent methyltransferase [Rhizobium mongolense]MBB4278079.1 SAM-dependent methyltransferase [Rhizobium mongolense]
MTVPTLDRVFGRVAFGADPSNYHAARPRYPEETWRLLRERSDLGPGIDILEIGAGTGLATAELLAHKPRRLAAVEPDMRLADFLRTSIAVDCLQVLALPFEDANLEPASFDLVASATAFHWLDAAPALKRIHGLLRSNGAVALWWNVFGDESRPDLFHDATEHLFVGHRASLSAGGRDSPPYALDADARIREMTDAGFVPDPPEFIRWTLRLDASGVRGLYATYSNVSALAPTERAYLLDALVEIVTGQFAGRVDRNMTTAIYTARRA